MIPNLSDNVKAILLIAGALIVMVIGGWIGWKLFVADNQAQAKHDEVAIHANQTVAKATGDAGAKASNTVAATSTKETITHEVTRDHYVEITKQPGADDPVSDPLWDAFTRSVCMRESAAGLPECGEVPKADPR